MLPEKCHEYECSGYWGLLPLLILGIVGCSANLLIMSGPGFTGQSFFFLRALSVSDMMYLFFSVGNFVEIMFFKSWSNSWSVAYYSVHWDIVIVNVFINFSGFLIVILTIDRYLCICKPTKERSNHPTLFTLLAFFTAFVIQLPQFLEEKIVYDCYRATLNMESCGCSSNNSSSNPCGFISTVRENLLSTYPWITYTVLAEMIAKIIPAILLVILNILMIRGYTAALHRRYRMSHHTKVEDLPEGNKKAEKRKIVSWENIEDNDTKRRKYKRFNRKEKNLINLLLLLGCVFLVTNIPIAIAKILLACGYKEEQYFEQFVVLSNVLEVFFASSNFYLYCLFHGQVRQKVWDKCSLKDKITSTKFVDSCII